MCNLYNLTTNQQAIRDMARVMQDSLGNLEPDLDVYPDTVSGDRAMGGYQLMVSGEILRGRYRTSFERPAASD